MIFTTKPGAIMAAKTILWAIILALLPVAPSNAADLRIAREYRAIHHYTNWARIWPQSCFLMPDVIVAVDALGPYCASPRGHRRYPWY